MHGIENSRVARAVIFKEHRIIEKVTPPGIVVLLTVVRGTVRAQIAVRFLKRHGGFHAPGGLCDKRIVAKRVGEHGRAKGVLSTHLCAPAHKTTSPVGWVEVARDIRLIHLVWLNLAQMSAHA